MCNYEKNKELVRVYGLCPWPHKFMNVAPLGRDRSFIDADDFLRFVDEEAAFDFDWELYLVWAPTRGGRRAVVHAACVGRSYNRKVS
jgi:hypothetical protein